jgi:hypothetical protein
MLFVSVHNAIYKTISLTANFMFIFSVSGVLLTSYAVIVTLISNSLGWTIEHGLLGFYLFFFLAHFFPLLQSSDRTGFYRIFRLVLMPSSTVSFPEVLLADALTSLSKVFKDFGTTTIAIYAQFMGANVIDYHDNAMIIVTLLASFPFV